MVDPYYLTPSDLPASISPACVNASLLSINNLVFINDSMLISSSKVGMEHMLIITEEFYYLNNTSTNHKKYVLVTSDKQFSLSRDNPTSVTFHLATSSLNKVEFINITLIPTASFFRFLAVWFNLNAF